MDETPLIPHAMRPPRRLLATAVMATAVLSLLITTTAFAQDLQARGYDQATLQQDLHAVQESADIVGLLAAVHAPNGVIKARAGTAIIGDNAEVPWDAQFRIASTTKTFVSTVVLQLVSEGVLSLDDKVERWLPGVVTGNGNDGSAVSLRQLLSHTSGIYNFAEDPGLTAQLDDQIYDTSLPEDLVAVAMNHPPLFAPGTGWHYSNTNYVLAAMVIDRATGLDWQEQVEHRIVRPLELRHTYATGTNPFILGPHAHSYVRRAGVPDPIDRTDTSVGHAGDAGLVSTTSDLTTFFEALVGGRLLSPAMLAEMQTTVPADSPPLPGGRYGLGLQWLPLSCGDGYWYHPGSHLGGFSTWTGVTADGMRSVVVSLNSSIGERTGPALNTLVDHALCAT